MMRNEKTKATDTCRCCAGCFPNGLISLLIAQVLLLLGFSLSMFTMFDCKFVVANVFGSDSAAPPGNSTAWGELESRTGFGFLSYQDASGVCLLESWGSEESHPNNGQGPPTSGEEQFYNYVDWLGESWATGRNCLLSSLGGAFVVFVWVLTMMCIAHIRPLRILAATIPVVGIMPLQLATLSVLNSEFCIERDCDLGRSGIAAICAGAMYFAGGITLCFTKKYSFKADCEEDISEPGEQMQEQRRRSRNVGDVEMVSIAEDIVEEVSFVIEEDQGRRSSGHVEEVVIGDGLAEAQEIKPDMVFLHEDGEENNNPGPSAVPPSPIVLQATPPEEAIPTVTDVRILEDGPKTKIAP
mmetsp:Transcript_5936/g.11649  ORF Transcript_5936/g.11649 Transcript_5936/m.11649 type:complete len:355 (-) Transcript_5936:32-1096(-)